MIHRITIACSLLLAACAADAPPKVATQSQQISGTCVWDGAGVLAYCGIDLAECLLSEGPLCEGGASFTQECAESWGSFQSDGCLQACPAGEYLCAWDGSIQCCYQ